MRGDSFEEDNSARLRRRLWGAAVLIAIAVIVLPLLLDGAGTESQFRRVERLREEPSTIVDSQGNRTVQTVPETPEVSDTPEVLETPEMPGTLEALETTELPDTLELPERPEIVIVSEEDLQSDRQNDREGDRERDIESDVVEQTTDSNQREDSASTRQPSMSAWVVRVEDYVDEQAALELRDRLRSAGFASFVRDRDASTDQFSVLVGPMIKRETAEKALGSVAAMLQNSPSIMSYP